MKNKKTYKCIKKYPQGPEVGTIVKDRCLGPLYFGNDGINYSPAFKKILGL